MLETLLSRETMTFGFLLTAAVNLAVGSIGWAALDIGFAMYWSTLIMLVPDQPMTPFVIAIRSALLVATVSTVLRIVIAHA